MSQPPVNNRFGQIFKALMLFCGLIWVWGMALMALWPWHKGGEWLAEFPIVAVCAPETVCAVPVGELSQARATGKLISLQPPGEGGELAYEALHLQWKPGKNLIESKVSAWNFQTTVRYRIENETPVLLEYQEISAKVFLAAMAGALLSLIGIYYRKLRPARKAEA